MSFVQDPVKTIKRSAPISLLLVAVLYMLCNVAYFAAVPKADILAAETTTASLFFTAVFGKQASRGLNILVILSAFGNLVTVLIGQSRVIREIGRQGVLPYPKFWVSTKPFGTPIGPYILKWGMTVLMIVAPPAGDAFDFGECSHRRPKPTSPDVLIMCNSGRPPELPRISVLLRNGSRSLPHPTPTQKARCWEIGVQSVGRCGWPIHPCQSPSIDHAVGPARDRYLWRLRELLLRHVLLDGPWNVSV